MEQALAGSPLWASSVASELADEQVLVGFLVRMQLVEERALVGSLVWVANSSSVVLAS